MERPTVLLTRLKMPVSRKHQVMNQTTTPIHDILANGGETLSRREADGSKVKVFGS
jgi:hypothetical protein